MALSAADTVDLLRFCGYAPGDHTLDPQLAGMSAEVQAVVTAQLGRLRKIECQIGEAAGDLDTNRAAVWYRNTNQVADLFSLLNAQAERLCALLGVLPGPFFGAGGSGTGSAVAPAVFVV